MKKVLLGILVVLFLIQFIRPKKNDSKIFKNDISTVATVPDDVKEMIKVSCADCHSNYTKYPWYNNIAPVSWWMAQHVNEGKEHLNFSEWAAYNKNQKQHIISDLEEVMETHEMPLKSYLITHKDSELTPEQYTRFLAWIKTIPIE
jgi:hypothetical protein